MAIITATAPVPDNTTYPFDARTVGSEDALRLVSVIGSGSGEDVVPADATAGLKVNLGADNDVTINSLPEIPHFTNNEYSNVGGDFTATANVGTKTITLSAYASTVLSSVLGVKNVIGGSITKINSAGTPQVLPVTTVTVASNVITLTDMVSTFSSGDTVIVRLIGPDKAFSGANNTVKTQEQYAIAGENNTALVLGTIFKPVNDPTYAPMVSRNTGTVTKASVKGTAGNVYCVRVTNENASARWFQIHNKSTAPAATEVPVRNWKIPAGTAANPGELKLDVNYLAPSHRCETGIGWAISTTALTFTDSATASEHNVEVTYV